MPSEYDKFQEYKQFISVTLDDVYLYKDPKELSETQGQIQRKYRPLVISIVSLLIISVVLWIASLLPLREQIIGYRVFADRTIIVSNLNVYSFDNENTLLWKHNTKGILSYDFDENGNTYLLHPGNNEKNRFYEVIDKIDSTGEKMWAIERNDEKSIYSFVVVSDERLLLLNRTNQTISVYGADGTLKTDKRIGEIENDSYRTSAYVSTLLPDDILLIIDPESRDANFYDKYLEKTDSISISNKIINKPFPTSVVYDASRKKIFISQRPWKDHEKPFILSMNIDGSDKKEFTPFLNDEKSLYALEIFISGGDSLGLINQPDESISSWNPDDNSIITPSFPALDSAQKLVSVKRKKQRLLSFISGFVALFFFFSIVAFTIVTDKMARKEIEKENRAKTFDALKQIFWNPSSDELRNLNILTPEDKKKSVRSTGVLFVLIILAPSLFRMYLTFAKYKSATSSFSVNSIIYVGIFSTLILIILLVALYIKLKEIGVKSYQDRMYQYTHLFRYREEIINTVSKDEIVIDAVCVMPPKTTNLLTPTHLDTQSMLLMTNKYVRKYDYKRKRLFDEKDAPDLATASFYPIKITDISNIEVTKQKRSSYCAFTITLTSGFTISEQVQNSVLGKRFAETALHLKSYLKVRSSSL